MSELKLIKEENKELRKKLSKDDKNFMLEVEFWLERYQLSKYEYHDLLNQILEDGITKSEENKSLWDIIENPIEYCDRFLIGKVKKTQSKKEEIGLMIILFVTMISLYILMINLTTYIPEIFVKEGSFVFTSGMLINSVSILLFSIIPIMLRRIKPFDRNRYKVRFFSAQALSLFFALMMGSIAEYSIVVNVNQYFTYGCVFVGMAILILKRKLII